MPYIGTNQKDRFQVVQHVSIYSITDPPTNTNQNPTLDRNGPPWHPLNPRNTGDPPVKGWWLAIGVVVRQPHSGRSISCPHNQRRVVNCGVSYRPISTGQLHGSLVPASTSCLSTQWSSWGPLTLKVYGNLISKWASRLDAFSGYPFRT